MIGELLTTATAVEVADSDDDDDDDKPYVRSAARQSR